MKFFNAVNDMTTEACVRSRSGYQKRYCSLKL